MARYSALAALVAVLLSQAAVALPSTPSSPACSPGTSQDANFDDLTGVPTLAFNPITTPYKGLYYQGFDFSVVEDGKILGGAAQMIPGVPPHSGTNYAASGVVSEMTTGTPMLTVNYPASLVTSFDLKSFYFACVSNLANGATALPAQCLISVTGYKGSDNTIASTYEVCSQQFQYSPSTITGSQQMAFSQPVDSCFTGIQYAVITYTPPGGLSATSPDLALLTDDVMYTTHSCPS